MTGLKATFAAFENLGDNCEFGIAQRYAGIEPLGLFRFAGTAHLPSLISAVETEFANFGAPGDVELFGKEGEYYSVHIRSFHMIYATPIHWGAQDADIVLRQELARINLLKRKLIEDLKDARKIFVRKGRGDAIESIRALSQALRRYGPNTLLWVTEADADHPSGSVSVLSDGLIAGRINKFAPAEDVPSLLFDDWIVLCKRCLDVLGRPLAKDED